MGNRLVEELILNIENQEYDPVIRTLIDTYYDPLYSYSISKYDKYDLTIDYEIIAEAIPILIGFRLFAEKELKGVLE